MKGASDALKKSHKNMNVDDVHEMMDDIAEQNDIANEISNAISSGPMATGVDDDDLMKELEELEQEELDKDLLNVGPAPDKLPDVPSTDLPSGSKEKEKKKGLEAFIWLDWWSYIWNSLTFLAKPVAADNIEDDPDMKELMQWAN